MQNESCPYCQGPTTSTINDDGSAYWNNCPKCRAYFHYVADSERGDYKYSTTIFFDIKNKEFFCELSYAENKVKVCQCGKMHQPIIDVKTIPDWNPNNIVEKISKLLIFW